MDGLEANEAKVVAVEEDLDKRLKKVAVDKTVILNSLIFMWGVSMKSLTKEWWAEEKAAHRTQAGFQTSLDRLGLNVEGLV